MPAGTHGPATAVWDVTPATWRPWPAGRRSAGRRAASHRVTAWQLNTARPGGRRAATLARPAPAAGGAGPARPDRPCGRRR